MCGIAGAVGHWPNRLADVLAMCTRLVHRGPDDFGQFDDESCSLAMRRLSIIDVAGGHQPIASESGDIVAVCNGELYNFQTLRPRLEALGHRFATGSDVEVAVHAYEAWGDGFLSDVNGMFALALWDSTRGRLFLARDRVGKKPLYYTLAAGGIAFSSELRSLMSLPGRRWTVDADACRAFCLSGRMPDDRTPFVEIRRLPPAHLGVWEDGHFALGRYWVPEPAAPPPDFHGALTVLRALLRDAVALRLISDVPLGAFLSGGLDSSVVVAMAAGVLGARVPTFNIAFPGYADFNEAVHARRVAQHFGCEHHEISVTPTEFQGVDELVWSLDEPLADPAALPTLLLSRAARSEVTVVLTGEGADEVFGGYDRYWLSLRGAALTADVPGVRAAAAAGLRFRGFRACDDSRVSRVLRSAYEGDGDPVLWSRNLMLAPALARVAEWAAVSTAAGIEPRGDGVRSGQSLADLQRYDINDLLPNGLLPKVDRMTMAASLEARCPYLDYRLIALGLGLPDSWKLRGRTSKVLLRTLASELLPAEIRSRPKHTFRVPLGEWLRGPLRPWLDRASASSVLSHFGIAPVSAVRTLVDAHVQGRGDYSRSLWALITLQLWLEEAGNRVNLERGA